MSESRSAARPANSSSCCLSSCSAKVRPAAPTLNKQHNAVWGFSTAHTETHREASGHTQTHQIRVQTWTDPCRHRHTHKNTHVMHARQAVQHSNTCCGPQQSGGEVLTQQLQAVWGGAATMTRQTDRCSLKVPYTCNCTCTQATPSPHHTWQNIWICKDSDCWSGAFIAVFMTLQSNILLQ